MGSNTILITTLENDVQCLISALNYTHFRLIIEFRLARDMLQVYCGTAVASYPGPSKQFYVAVILEFMCTVMMNQGKSPTYEHC
jgi:hypothetical protein